MTINVTLAQLSNKYADYLQAANPKISPRSPNTYWAIQGGAMSAMLLDLYYNLQLVENSIYPQNAVGDQVDFWLYVRGLQQRGGETFGSIDCTLNSTVPITIPAGTIFTDTGNTVTTNNQYQALQAYNITSATDVFTLYALQPGPNYIEPTFNLLTSGSFIAKVQRSTNGQNEESDQSCIARILASIRVPKGGSRSTDYFEFALEANSILPSTSAVITFAIVEPSFLVLNQVGILGVFPLIGTRITEYQLNQGLLPSTAFVQYSRTPSQAIVESVSNYIQSQRLIGAPIRVLPNYTYIIAGDNELGHDTPPFGIDPNPNLIINVALAPEYSLATVLNINSQDQDNNPIVIQLTVEQLIQRESRRSICNQEFGATIEGASVNQITANSISEVLNFQLSATNGQLAQILTDVQIPGGNILVPKLNYKADALYYTYDVADYSNIDIGLI